MQEREQFIQEKVHEAVSQRVQELHENPENGQVKVSVLSVSVLISSSANMRLDYRSPPGRSPSPKHT